MSPHDPAADHRDPGGRDTGHAPDQLAHAVGGFSQGGSGGLDRKPPRHFAHGREQRQPAIGICHRFIGDRGAAGGQQALGLIRIRRQMQIGKEDLALAKLAPLRRLRFLHLHDHVGGGEYFARGIHNGRASRPVDVVARANAEPGAALDHDTMASRHILSHRRWRETDAIFVELDLFWHTNAHGLLLRPQQLSRLPK